LRKSKEEENYFDKAFVKNTNHKMASMAFAIAVSIAIVVSISLGIINYTLNIGSAANAISDTVAEECRNKMLRYEQKGYYTGGALEFNEVVSYCSK
jgi:predicted TIM-barrel enzyme